MVAGVLGFDFAEGFPFFLLALHGYYLCFSKNNSVLLYIIKERTQCNQIVVDLSSQIPPPYDSPPQFSKRQLVVLVTPYSYKYFFLLHS